MPRVLLWCLPLLWMLVLVAGFLVYGANGHDDAHINFWFAHTLLERGELVNYNGDRADQATNLLLVFVTALLARVLPVGLVTSGYLVDIMACLACCSLLTWMARKACPAMAAWPALLALSCLSFLVWTFGGMGSVLAALCLLSGVAVWWQYIEQPKPVHGAALLAVTVALVLVRPEMSLVIVAVSFYPLVFHWHHVEKRQRCLKILLFNFSGCLLLFLWQKFYFSSWLPVPVMAKQSGDFQSGMTYGALYALIYGIVNPVLIIAFLFSVPVLASLLWKSRAVAQAETASTEVASIEVASTAVNSRHTLWILLVGAFQVYTGFVWLAGGDWMHAGRFMVPVVPLAALLLVSVLSTFLRKPVMTHIVLALLVLVGFRLHPLLFVDGSPGVPAWTAYRMQSHHVSYSPFEQYNYEHLRDMPIVDHMNEMVPVVYEKLGRPVQILSGQAGMVFYKVAEAFPGMAHFTDMRGLVESSLTLCPALENWPRDMYGLAWDGYREYFSALPMLQEKCGIQTPDIIFDMIGAYRDHPDIFQNAGYVMVHEQRGSLVDSNAVLPPGKDAISMNFIFVHKDILPLLHDAKKRDIDYSAMPLHRRWGYDWFYPAP